MRLEVVTSGESKMRSYSSAEVVRLTGITPRQLQWWDERGIVVATRSGRNRSYEFEQIAELIVIVALRRKGFSLQSVRKVIRFIQKEFGKRLAETVLSGSEYHLLTDGRTIYIRDSAQGVIDVLKQARQAMFGVCLTDEVRQVLSEAGVAASETALRRSSQIQHPTKGEGTKQRRVAS